MSVISNITSHINEAVEQAINLNKQLHSSVVAFSLYQYTEELKKVVKKLNTNIFNEMNTGKTPSSLSGIARTIYADIRRITNGTFQRINEQTEKIFKESVERVLLIKNINNRLIFSQLQRDAILAEISHRFAELTSGGFVETVPTIRGSRGNVLNILGISGTPVGTNLITVTFETQTQPPFFVTELITIRNATPSSYDGSYLVSESTTTTVEFRANTKTIRTFVDENGNVVEYTTIYEQVAKLAEGETHTWAWYRNTLRTIGHRYTHNPSLMFRDERRENLLPVDRRNGNHLRRYPRQGNMFFFEYKAEGAETLPYYDSFPLVYVIHVKSKFFYGANLHYLDPRRRAIVINNLKKKGILTVPFACVNKYTIANVQISSGADSYGYLQLDPLEWETSIFIPLERFTCCNTSGGRTVISSDRVHRETESGGPRNKHNLPTRPGKFSRKITTRRYGTTNR